MLENLRLARSHRLLLLVGLASLAAGIVISLRMVGGGVDFPVLYVMGRGLLTGTNVYVPEVTAAFPRDYGVSPSGMYYPPATGFAVLPLALLPFGVAKWAFASLIVLVVIAGIRALVRVAAPQAPSGVWMMLAGLALASSAMRWGMMLLQVAPLVFGLLCWFVGLLHTGKDRVAVGLAMLAMWLKMTLSLPFVGLLALRRRWIGIAVVGASWVALNALGFWRMGPDSFAEYQRSVAVLGEFGNIDSPDVWHPAALPRLDWVSLFYGLTSNLTFARFAALGLSGAAGLWIAWQTLRTRRADDLRTTAAFLGALVCLGSLAVYHHQYDAILFLAPALIVLLSSYRFRPVHLLAAPLLVTILLLPIGRAQLVLGGLLGPTGIGLVKLLFPVAFTFALAGCLLLIRERAAETARERAVSSPLAHGVAWEN